jgi:hypothetical protein
MRFELRNPLRNLLIFFPQGPGYGQGPSGISREPEMKEDPNDRPVSAINSMLGLVRSEEGLSGAADFLQLTRRRLLEILAGAGMAAFSGCGGGSSAASTSGSSSGTGSGATASCVLTPKLTVGPYFVDEKLDRSDLTTNTTDSNVLEATPLTLTMTIWNTHRPAAPRSPERRWTFGMPMPRESIPTKPFKTPRARPIFAAIRRPIQTAWSPLEPSSRAGTAGARFTST